MLEIVQRLVTLEWRRQGAVIRELPIRGCRVWLAEFQPRPADLERLRARSGIRLGRRFRPPTVVLFHGLGASSTSFHAVIPPLRRGYRVIVPDLPGYGWSRVPSGREFLTFPELVDVAERLVARVAPRGAYVAGNSMGGWISAKLAARRPDLVRAMALLNPGGPALRVDDWVDFARIVWAEEKGAMQEWLERVFHRPPLAMRLFLRDFRRIMSGPSVSQLMASLEAEDFLSEDELRKVRCPSVLVWGERDRLIPDGCRSFYLEKLKGVRYEPVADCGHCPQIECPHRTAEILLELPSLTRPSARPARQAAGGGRGAASVAGRRRGGIAAVARA